MPASHPGFLAIAFLAMAAVSAPGARGMDLSDALQFADQVPDRPRLALTFVDCAGLPAEMLAAVQAETAALAGAMGVWAEIRTLPPGADLDPAAVTLIVMDTAPPAHLTRGVMGAVQRQGSIRALWIYSANVAVGTRLGWRTRDRWSLRERQAFATAMARVALHEIVHLVCPWREHEPEGLMASELDAATLIGSRIRLTSELRRDFTLGVDALSGDAFSLARSGPARRP